MHALVGHRGDHGRVVSKPVVCHGWVLTDVLVRVCLFCTIWESMSILVNWASKVQPVKF